MKFDLNFFTTATADFEYFIGIFAFFSLYTNVDSVVEVGVDDPNAYLNANKELLSAIDDTCGRGRLHVRHAPANLSPGTARYVISPEIVTTYVYISDIDILHLQEGITRIHELHMAESGLPYSNGLRNMPIDQYQLLSGLHFTPFDIHYPLPDISDFNLSQVKDEYLLYNIVCRKGLPLPDKARWFRPVHGIHVSTNRPPFGGIVRGKKLDGWNFVQWRDQYRDVRTSPEFCQVESQLPARAVAVIQVLDVLTGVRPVQN